MEYEINCLQNVDFNEMSLMVNTTIGQLQGKASKSDPKGAFLQFVVQLSKGFVCL